MSLIADKLVVSESCASTAVGESAESSVVDTYLSLAELGAPLSEFDDCKASDEELWQLRCQMVPSYEDCCPWMSFEKAMHELHTSSAFDGPSGMQETADVILAGQEEGSQPSVVSLNGSFLTSTTAIPIVVRTPTTQQQQPSRPHREDEVLDEEDRERLELYTAMWQLKLWLGVLDGIGVERPQLDDDVLAALNLAGAN